MRILIDMNLSPAWTDALSRSGIESVHWSQVGQPDASDKDILEWAAEHNFVVFTHDLDFGTLLAAHKTMCPSVIQIRTQDVTPAFLLKTVTLALQQFKNYIEKGALITIDNNRARVRVLPIN
jgi:predicted nuclease of predicted toxin-antitoxin system